MRAARVAELEVGRMWAWRAGAHELRLERARVPVLRAPRHVLLRVQSAGVNPIDLAMLEGYGAAVLGAWRRVSGEGGGGGPEEARSLTPGREAAGCVVAAGPAARCRPGERVWAALPPHVAGTHAQYVLLDDRWVGPLPECMRSVESGGGGALYAAMSALSALEVAGLQLGVSADGGRALLLGLGGVGQAALQLLAAHRVQTVVSCSSGAERLAQELGASAVVDRRDADWGRRVAQLGPFRFVLDAAGLGGRGAVQLARLVAVSRYVTLSPPALALTDRLGLCAGSAAAALQLATQNAEAAAERGGAGPQVRWAFFRTSRDRLRLVTRLVERGLYKVPVQCVVPWRSVPAAYAAAGSGGGGEPRAGKVIVDFSCE